MEKWEIVFVSAYVCVLGLTVYFTPILYRKWANFRASLQEYKWIGFRGWWRLRTGKPLPDDHPWREVVGGGSDMRPGLPGWDGWDDLSLSGQYRMLEKMKRKPAPIGGHRAGFITRLDMLEKDLEDYRNGVAGNRRRAAVAATKRKGASR